jgi:hypothetical protein
MTRGLLITLIWFPLAGAAMCRLTGGRSWFLMGIGVSGFALFAGGLFGLAPVTMLIALATAAVAVLLFVPRSMEHWLEPVPFFPRSASVLMWSILAIVVTCALITPVTDYDGRVFWLLKAKAIVHENGIDGPFFRGETTMTPRNSYPLLMPLNAAAVMLMSGDTDDIQVRALYAFVLVALALHLRRELADLVSPGAGAWAAAVLVWLPRFGVSAESGAISAYSDLALSAFIAAAALELIRGESAFRFGLWIGFACLTKNEGLPLSMILFLASIPVFKDRMWRAIVGYAPAAAVVMTWRNRVSLIEESDFVGLFSTASQRVEHLLTAAGRALRHFIAIGEWGIFWPLVLAALVTLALRRAWRPAALFSWFFAATIALFTILYATATPAMLEGIDHAMPRLLMPLAGPGLAALALASKRLTVNG